MRRTARSESEKQERR